MVKFGRGANSMRHTLLIPLVLLLIALPAAAQAPEAAQAPVTTQAPDPVAPAAVEALPDRGQRLERAKTLHEEANGIRRAAEEINVQAKKACWDRFLVSACLEDARMALRDETARARKLDQEAREIEREVKKQDIAEREARRIEEAPRKAAEAAAQAEKNRLAQEEALRRVAEKQAEAAARKR